MHLAAAQRSDPQPKTRSVTGSFPYQKTGCIIASSRNFPSYWIRWYSLFLLLQNRCLCEPARKKDLRYVRISFRYSNKMIHLRILIRQISILIVAFRIKFIAE